MRMHRPYSASEAHRLLVDTVPTENGVAMVRLQGEADLHTAPILRESLNGAIEGAPATLIVDLTGVTFIDSMMLGVLLSATRRARPQGTELRIVVDDPHVRRIFELTLLDHVMKLYPSVDVALADARDSSSGD
jgi:anti-sigma B factor antagonist